MLNKFVHFKNFICLDNFNFLLMTLACSDSLIIIMIMMIIILIMIIMITTIIIIIALKGAIQEF